MEKLPVNNGNDVTLWVLDTYLEQYTDWNHHIDSFKQS